VIWDSLLKGLGSILSFFYEVVPSYGVAIVLLTILVRIVLIPLTIKQTRSMQAMQRVQPKVKELQRKYKGNRQKMNEELMKLYKEHQVNPLGGCLPLLLQLPVFFALFSVLRATIPAVALTSSPIPMADVDPNTTVCRPNTEPSVGGPAPTEVVCEGPGGERQSYTVSGWENKDSGDEIQPPPSLFRCVPRNVSGEDDEVEGFLCDSPLGTGHLSRESALFAAIVEDRATFLGIELACSPTQAISDVGIRQCAGPGTVPGGPVLIGYFGLVVLMVGTTWYQQRQMMQASAGPGAQQAQLMAKIMPVFLGVISISISAGVLVYWVTTNAWQIGQQHIMLRSRAAEPASAADKSKSSTSGQTGKNVPKASRGNGSKVKGNAGSRKKRRKR
jgi:YidC/Oxa1 family membrane protein insertase